jgi:leucyl/phenylalanyl-tRNA--protein transferase
MNPQLQPQVLLAAYSRGIFPMADEEDQVMWFCPDPRAIIELDGLRTSKTLRQLYRQGRFELTVNREFAAVMAASADRPEGTWISHDFLEAYARLHELGYAHSVEAWQAGELAGGLYGVTVGGVFCGESMFHRQRDASKVALVYLVERMVERGFEMLDVQFMTHHLARMGAIEIPRQQYLRRLARAIDKPCTFAD